MKRLISIFLVLSLIFTASMPIYAEESDSKGLENAILAVKNVVTIPSDYKDFNYSSSQYEINGKIASVWYIYWNKEDSSAGISATVDSDGHLLNYNKYTDKQNEGLGNITREAGKVNAAAFLAKARPDLASDMRLIENVNNSNTFRHYYNYRLYKDEIPVNFIQAYLEVDKHSGEVVNFGGLETDISITNLPPTDGTIPQDVAKKAFLEKIGVKLRYYSNFDYNKKTLTIFPAYAALDLGQKAIDAKTGEAVNLYHDYYFYGSGGMESQAKSMDSAGAQNAMSKEELEAIDKISGLISKEKAESILKSFVPSITSDMKVVSTTLSKNYIEPNKYVWEIGYDGAYGMVNAKTGELISYYIYNENSRTGNVGISETKAKDKAESFIKKVAADKFQQTKYMENNGYYNIYRDSNEITEYSFTYYRQVNGIDFTNNNITVTVNKASGMITQYNCNWYDDANFPSIDNMITEAAAYDIINKTGNYDLIYKKINKGDIALVYDFIQSPTDFLVDPVTGAKLGWDGKPYKDPSMPEYSDLKGHWSEATVTKLLENGYYLQGEKFNPNSKITQVKFLRYLYSPMQAYYEDDDFYKMLFNDKVVKENEKSPNSELTRQDAAKFVVRYLGQGKIAEHPEIFINPFKDTISTAYKGYAATAYGLKIMQGDTKGRFNGTKVLTNAESATIIFKALQVK